MNIIFENFMSKCSETSEDEVRKSLERSRRMEMEETMKKYLVDKNKDMQTALDLVKDNGGNVLKEVNMGLCAGTVVECTPEVADALGLKPWNL